MLQPKLMGPCAGVISEPPAEYTFWNGRPGRGVGCHCPYCCCRLHQCDGQDQHHPSPSHAQVGRSTERTFRMSDTRLCSYNNHGGDNWTKPGFLDDSWSQASAMYPLAAEANVPLWCGECGPHNGGVKDVTDRVISSFWYMDALGGLARLGLQQHGRQALVGAYYGLLQVASSRACHMPVLVTQDVAD